MIKRKHIWWWGLGLSIFASLFISMLENIVGIELVFVIASVIVAFAGIWVMIVSLKLKTREEDNHES